MILEQKFLESDLEEFSEKIKDSGYYILYSWGRGILYWKNWIYVDTKMDWR